MCWIGYISFVNGDPRRLYHGFDYQGRLCGVNETVANKTLLYWPDTNRLDLALCIEECPGTVMRSVVVPRETVVVTPGRDYVRTEILRQNATLMTYPTKKVGGRFCLPTSPALGTGRNIKNMTRSIAEEMEYSTVAVLTNSFKDICNAWSVLLFMLPVSMAVGYGYVFLLRYCAKTVLHVVLAALILGSASLSFYMLYYVRGSDSRAQELLGKYTTNPMDVVWLMGVGFAGLCFILLCAGYSMLTKMEKVSAVVEAAGDAMWSVQLLLCMPVIEVLLKMMYTVVWVYVASYVVSNGDISGSSIDVGDHQLHGMVRTFHYTLMQKFCIIYYCIGYIWGLEFISMLFKFVVSYAVSMWYFQPCRADFSKPEVTPEVWRSGFSYACYYHAGSLCIGAAVTIVLYIFIPVHVVNELFLFKTQASINPVVKALVYSCTCCIKCTQEIVSYVNKGAIVEMVLRGDHDFFTSAGSAMRVMRNADESVVSLHGVTLVFQIVGLVTSAFIGAYATFWFTGTVNIFSDRNSEYFLENRVGVTCVAGIVAMAVSTVFMWTLDLVADSLLFCWLVEGEDDRTHQTYAPKLLRNVVRYDDWNPLKDNRMIKGGGSLDYQGNPMDSYNSSMNSQNDPNSPSKRGVDGGWSGTSHLTNTGQTAGTRYR